MSVSKISCRDLANVEIGGGENDPFVTLKFGQWTDKTEAIDGAGKNAEWLKLTSYFPVTSQTLEADELKVSAFQWSLHMKISSKLLKTWKLHMN